MSHHPNSYKQRATSMIQSVYVDLGTLENNAKHLYSGAECTTPFSKDVEKSSWFSTIWTQLKQENSNDTTPVWKAQRNSDFLLKVFLRGTAPSISLKPEFEKKGYQIAVTPYFGHNVISLAEMYFNELRAVSFDNYFLDMHASIFTKDYGHWVLYNKQVGNRPELVEFGTSIPSFDFKVPLPFSFSNSPANALKICCLRAIDTKFSFHLNTDMGRLVRVRRPLNKNGEWEYISGDVTDYLTFSNKNGKVSNFSLWGKFAVVTEEERDYHRRESHMVVVEQTQTYDHSSNQTGSGIINAPFHWSGAVKHIMFGTVNRTAERYNNYSNYTNNPHDASKGQPPIKNVSLNYDSQPRFSNFPFDMFSENEMEDMPNATPDIGIGVINNALGYSPDNNPSGATVYDRLMTTMIVEVEDETPVENPSNVKILLPNEYGLLLRGITETAFIVEKDSVKIPTGESV